MDWVITSFERKGEFVEVKGTVSMTLDEFISATEDKIIGTTSKDAEKAKPKKARKMQETGKPKSGTAEYQRWRKAKKKAEKESQKKSVTKSHDYVSDEKADRVQKLQDKIDKLEEETSYANTERP